MYTLVELVTGVLYVLIHTQCRVTPSPEDGRITEEFISTGEEELNYSVVVCPVALFNVCVHESVIDSRPV
jgi:hypothetical protein